MKGVILAWLIVAACLQAFSVTGAPSIIQVSTPYPALESVVKIAGVSYGPGRVAYGPVGTPVAIRGSNFGTAGSISFPGPQMGAVLTINYTTSDPSTITLVIPSGATTGNISITTADGLKSNAVPFMVTTGNYSGTCSITVLPPQPPAISSVTPLSGPAGTMITITGSHYGAAQGTSTVAVAGIIAEVIAWRETSIVVWVPNNAPAGLWAVVVTVESQSSYPPGSFTVSESDSGQAGSCLLVQ